jgi:signal transduction histidine kinase
VNLGQSVAAARLEGARASERVRSWALALVAVLACVILYAATMPVGAAAQHASDGSSQTIREAQFCQRPGLGDDIPDASCHWEPVPLAKLWRGQRDSRISDAWYRLRFHLDAVPQRGLAMYVVAFNRTGRLFSNGQYVSSFGVMEGTLPMNWNRSEFAVLPPGLLHAGDNEIEIQQRVYSWEPGWLAPVRLGSEEELEPIWHSRTFWQNDLVRLLGASTAAIGLFMLAVWLGRRSQATYFWFGCASLLWAVISLDYYALNPPLPALAWERFTESAQVLRSVLMFMFVLRYCGRRMPLVEAASWVYFLVGAVMMVEGWMPADITALWYLLVLVVSLYFFYLLVREGLRKSWIEGTLLAVAAFTQMVLSAYDWWLFSEHTWTDRVYLAHFSAPLYLFGVGTILIKRFVESLNGYERLAGVLEQRVSEKATELQLNYEQLVEARRNEALALERTRIMSEMHDGIGSQLTMALSLVRRLDREADPAGTGEDGRVATVLRESIEDLQLIIDSLEPVEHDLLTVLGTLRYRLQDRLGKGGIDLHWNVVDLPPLPMLTPHSVLSILRIVQEAFANCLKHAGASRITVTTGLAGAAGVDEVAHIAIVDNGRGIDGTRVGRGLENMRRRAEALGGHLEITSRAGLTEVLLSFPSQRRATS